MWNEAKKRRSLLRSFLYLSLTHAPIIHRSILRMLWMQRNIWCIVAATFKMMAMSSARSAGVSAVKPKQTTVSADLSSLLQTTLRHIPTLASPHPLPPVELLMSERHRCPHLHVKHQVWITLSVESADIQMWQKCGGHVSLKWLCLLQNVKRKWLCLLHYVIGKPNCYTL